VLDPGNGHAHGALGFMYYLQRRFLDMDPHFQDGLAANPKDTRLLYLYVTALISTSVASG
jgi:hypothetical protein